MEKFTPLIRLLLQVVAGSLATHGMVKEDSSGAFIESGTAAMVMALTGIWSYYEKRQIKTAAMHASTSMAGASIASMSDEIVRLRKENEELAKQVKPASNSV